MQLASLGPHGYDINIRMWIPHSYCDISDISAIPAYKLFFNARMAASKVLKGRISRSLGAA